MFDLTTYEIVRKKYHAEGEWIVQWCTLYIKFILLFICEILYEKAIHKIHLQISFL
jgi:hypothetical protein